MEDGNITSISSGSLESRPGVLLIGFPNVGKRTILSRLLSADIPDTTDLAGGILCQGWTIDTQYYSADIFIWTSHLGEDFSFEIMPDSKQLTALVMVFDLSDESSFLALKDWVTTIDLENFEILLCMGNKVDLVPGHNAHAEYRRYLQKCGGSNSDPHPEFWDYGIEETEGFSLLGDEEPSSEIKKSCLEWCLQYNIEYIEACASNSDFDKCLSVNGDIQGVARLYGALSAHMWPGMVIKSGERVTSKSPIEEGMSDDESDYEIEYEVLSRGSDDPWEYTGASFNELPSASGQAGFGKEQMIIASNAEGLQHDKGDGDGAQLHLSKSRATNDASSSHCNAFSSETSKGEVDCGSETFEKSGQKLEGLKVAEKSASEVEAQDAGRGTVENIVLDQDAHYGYEDLERLISDIGNTRDSLRLMPDFQRRDMAAKLAMKMASMFADSSDDDGNFE